MESHVRKWGNSLALRIPKSFAAEAGLSENLPVDLSILEGRLVVQPRTEKPLSLESLLAEVTEENLHGEWDTGAAVGREIW